MSKRNIVVMATSAINEFGEISAMELAEYCKISRYDAHAVLRRMNKPTKYAPKRLHVVRYINDHDGARKYPRPVYAMGNKPDAKKPKADQLAVKRAYYARLKSRTLMNSVFNMALQWRAGA